MADAFLFTLLKVGSDVVLAIVFLFFLKWGHKSFALFFVGTLLLIIGKIQQPSMGFFVDPIFFSTAQGIFYFGGVVALIIEKSGEIAEND